MNTEKPRILILGLGNVGAQYAETRHNVGFMAADRLALDLDLEFQAGAGDYYCASRLSVDKKAPSIWRRWFGKSPELRTEHKTQALIAKPTTLMNRSGIAARQALERYGMSPQQLLVITDDFHLPVGALRLKSRGSDGGHNGLKSLIQELGTDEFPRIRLGIGPKPKSSEIIPFVLGEFGASEQFVVQQVTAKTSELCRFLLSSDLANSLDIAASKYNIVRPDPAPGSSGDS